jgi:hypothetical protein
MEHLFKSQDNFETVTVEHLREVLVKSRDVADYRTELLAAILPHIEEWAKEPPDSNFIPKEFCIRYEHLIARFKLEYMVKKH